jgi:hypothetical protein
MNEMNLLRKHPNNQTIENQAFIFFKEISDEFEDPFSGWLRVCYYFQGIVFLTNLDMFIYYSKLVIYLGSTERLFLKGRSLGSYFYSSYHYFQISLTETNFLSQFLTNFDNILVMEYLKIKKDKLLIKYQY